MCSICKSLIYDILIDPLAHKHMLQGYINYKALHACALEVADCFYRAVHEFPIFPVSFFQPSYIQYPELYMDKALAKCNAEEWLWNTFHEDYPLWAYELEHAIDTCVTTGVARNTCAKEQLVKQFFMEKLREILIMIPTIHKQHTLKIREQHRKSLGPVPLWHLIEVRQKAGLVST